jgi:hypothetical protein
MKPGFNVGRFIGRNWPVIGIGVGVVFIVVLFFLGKDSPSQVASQFLVALAKGDVDTLVKDSYYQGSEEQLRKEWEFAVKEAGPYYRFVWRIKDERQSTDTAASIQLGWRKNATSPASYEDNTELPMVKDGGRWKVDVRAIDRELYPALPR